MKIYPRVYEPISRKPSPVTLSHMGAAEGSLDDLARRFKKFYRQAHVTLFDMYVKQIWLESKYRYNSTRRTKRSGNGYMLDWSLAYFFNTVVGISQKPLTTGFYNTAIPNYFEELFPNFSDHDPFTEPKYFKFPYKHVTLDHMLFVYQHHERLEMLAYAEKKHMRYTDFIDWATNQALCYNDEMQEVVYQLSRHSYIPYLKKVNYYGKK